LLPPEVQARAIAFELIREAEEFEAVSIAATKGIM